MSRQTAVLVLKKAFRTETKVPDFISTMSRTIKCNHCSKLFVYKQGLSAHEKCLHGVRSKKIDLKIEITRAILLEGKRTALYKNGWVTGIIVYFHRELKEYKVDYADKTSDYLSYNDFDGVEVI